MFLKKIVVIKQNIQLKLTKYPTNKIKLRFNDYVMEISYQK